MKLVAIIALISIILDQVTKQIITRNMEIGDRIPVLGNFLSITYHRNSGAAWGIMQGQMFFFYIMTAIAIAGIIYWLYKIDFKTEKVMTIALALILGGAIGNFIDRILYQSVIDFISTYWWGYSFPIFNIADMSLVIGVGLMAIDALFLERRRLKKDAMTLADSSSDLV